MQTLTGKIVSIVPTGEGGYKSKQGWINTFIMTIQGPNTQVSGEIGSKSSPYPSAVGQEITVEGEQTQYGLKFKKINPQYSGGGQQGRGQGGSKKDVDWDKIAEGKVLCNMISAAITSGQIKCPDIRTAQYLTNVIMGKATDPQGGDPNPEYSDNPPEPEDDIPF